MVIVVTAAITVGSWIERAHTDVAPGWIPIPTEENPLALGSPSTITQAQSLLPFPIHLPDDPIASQATLTGVWVDPDHAQLGLVFNGEVTVMMWPNHYPDALKYFQDWIEANTAQAKVVQLGTAPALAIEGGTDQDASNPAWVEVVTGGIDINLYSYKHSADELLTLAGTMVP